MRHVHKSREARNSKEARNGTNSNRLDVNKN
jgi:hypothetical protein